MCTSGNFNRIAWRIERNSAAERNFQRYKKEKDIARQIFSSNAKVTFIDQPINLLLFSSSNELRNEQEKRRLFETRKRRCFYRRENIRNEIKNPEFYAGEVWPVCKYVGKTGRARSWCRAMAQDGGNGTGALDQSACAQSPLSIYRLALWRCHESRTAIAIWLPPPPASESTSEGDIETW